MSSGDDDLDAFFGRARTARPVLVTSDGAPARDRTRSSGTRSAGARAADRGRAGARPRQGSAARTPGRRTATPRRATRPAPPRSGGPRTAPSGTVRPTRPAGRATPRTAPAPRRAVPLDGAGARRRTQRRLALFVATVLVVVAAVGARLADVQVVGRDRYVAYGVGQRDGSRTIPAGRGAVYDRNGQPFALSVVRFDVVVDPQAVTDPSVTARQLSRLLDVPTSEVRRKLAADNRYQVLARRVPQDVADRVRDADVRGISFEEHYVRDHPSGELAASVVGRTVADGGVTEDGRQGISGIEVGYDAELTGTPGTRYYERDPAGNTIAGGQEHVEPARPGTDLYLTLDQQLQYAAEQALLERVAETRAAGAMAVISRPSTGEVLAMASVSSDDEGEVSVTTDNRPVTAVFEPGSVNKMITVAGALEEGVVEPDTILDVPDSLQMADKVFSDHDPHPTAAWSVTDILVTSSNIGTIKIAMALGAEEVDRYLRAFGFGSSTGLGFPAEEDGIMLPLENWSGTSLGAIPIGQGISVTALQMLAAYNVIANDGVYVAPRLVAAKDSGDGRVPTDASPSRRVVSPATADAMSEMLAKVVSDGTGAPAQVPGYVAAGKTGTARIPQDGADPEDGYLDAQGRYHYQSSFVGFVDGADLSIIVSIQDAETSIYGSELAGPVFSELASVALRRYQVPPPELAARAAVAVPELSSSARAIEEDPGVAPPTTAG